jgi:hypothetical protein
MTFKQALELGGNVRKGEKGSLVVFASSITRLETDSGTGNISKNEIRSQFQPSVQSVLTALSLSLPEGTDRGFEKVSDVVYLTEVGNTNRHKHSRASVSGACCFRYAKRYLSRRQNDLDVWRSEMRSGAIRRSRAWPGRPAS